MEVWTLPTPTEDLGESYRDAFGAVRERTAEARSNFEGLAMEAFDVSLGSEWTKDAISAANEIASHQGLDPRDNEYLRKATTAILVRADSCARWARDHGAIPDPEVEGELPPDGPP